MIVGIQPVRELLFAKPDSIERIVLIDRSSPPLDAISRLAAERNLAVERRPRAELDRISKGAQHQGVVAFAAELQLVELSELLASSPSLLMVLDRISDPQNFGAIVRSCVALGAHGVVWPENASAPLSAATFRASAGAIEHARLCRVRSLTKALDDMRAAGLRVIGLAGEGTSALHELDLKGPVALVVGFEGSGLRRGVRASCDELARLPARPPIAALNASVAAAVSLYEVWRQRA